MPIGTRTTKHFNKGYVCMYTLPLLVRQATAIASFKEGVRDFLAGNV